jgi:AraC family transcriptional regulator of adaptative response / DNA-3-methyladenine glycosylase II
MLRFLGARATPGVEHVVDGHYYRSISLNGSDGSVDVSCDADNDALIARVQFGDPRSLFLIVERLRAMFDLNADWAAIAPSLRSDPVLAVRVDGQPGLRVPGCWSGFELAVRAILGQQITVKGATTLAGSLVRAFGRPYSSAPKLSNVFPAPGDLADADLTSIGLTKTRAATIRGLARAVVEGTVRFEGVVAPEDFLSRLCEIPGIGAWTAQYIAMRALGEPDALPSGDLGLLKRLGVTNSTELEKRAEAWRPWRAYAAMYLWSVPAQEGDNSRASSKRSPERTAESPLEPRVPLGL